MSIHLLINCFENEIIPLLEEYFFGDYGKIGLVLGDSFVKKDDTEKFEFSEFEGYATFILSKIFLQSPICVSFKVFNRCI